MTRNFSPSVEMKPSLPSKQILSGRLLLGVISALSFTTVAQSAVIVDDTFADGSRGPTGNQNPPSSLNWYTSGAASTLIATTGTMTQSAGASAIGYYTTSGSPISLADGQTMTLTLSFVPTFPIALTSDNVIRFALFNSTGSRVSADGGGTSPGSGVYSPYVGYMGGVGNGLSLYERNSGSNNLINSIGSGGYTSLQTGAPLTLVSGTTYTYTLELERSGSNMILTSSLTGGALSGRTITYTDTTSAFTSFDTVTLYGTSAVPTLAYTEVEITVVPEPGTVGMTLFGVFAAASMMRRRTT